MGLLDFWKKESKDDENVGFSIQMRSGISHPFGILDNYIPLNAEYELYKTMREAVPVLDTAISRIVRLVGKFEVECNNDKAQKELDEFLKNIKVNSNQTGIHSFVQSYLDQLIECGNSVGEIVLNNAKNDIYALRNADIRTIKLKKTDNPLENVICQVQQGHMEPVELPYQDLILFTPLNPEGDSPYGVSLYRSMPFMTGILLKIFNSMGLNWERFGNLKYSVIMKPQKDSLNGTQVKERIKIIEESFRKAMEANKKGKAADFYGIGDIEIKVIGADNQILDSSVPVKQVLEQLVSKTGLPPFLLGLSWSTTERMSQQQADFLTSELESYRGVIEPVIKYIIDKWKTVTGKDFSYEIIWDDINLQDLVEIAKAELYKQQSEGKKIENAIKKRDEGIISQEDAAIELGYEKAYKDVTIVDDTNLNNSQSNKVLKNAMANENISLKSPFNSTPEDEEQFQIEKDTLKAYMKCVKRLEDKILSLVLEPTEEKGFNKTKNIPEDYKNKVEEAVDQFVRDMVGEGDNNNYGTYGTYLLNAFAYGIIRGNNTVKEDHGEEGRENNRERASYNHSYVQELLNNGMELVKTKAKDKKEEILNIMAEHTSAGDNPNVWARTLREEFENTISGEKWYWERLARSESAMAIDRGEMAEYKAEGFFYCEWSASPDACHICRSLNGQMWHIDDSPRVVEDTHPHCRCRKKPRTKRQYDEYMVI